jgi:hypothetical protein
MPTEIMSTTISPIGLLSSQIGYDVDAPKRIILRGPDDFLTADAVIELTDTSGAVAWRGKPDAWGELWGSYWWVADFADLRRTGAYVPRLVQAGGIRLVGDTLDIAEQALFSQTAMPCGPGHLSKRKLLAQVRPGWFDAGALWQLVSSHCPQVAYDAPSALHDEDWISHNGGYLMGLARWRSRKP